MELPAAAILLLFAFTSVAMVTSHPIAAPGVLPKEYYERQNLPDIPGYIPVYIKHDDEPVPKWKTEGKVSTGSSITDDGKVEEVVPDTGRSEVEQVKQYPQDSVPEHKGKGKKVTASKHTKSDHKE